MMAAILILSNHQPALFYVIRTVILPAKKSGFGR
jgi:hypothetical protein